MIFQRPIESYSFISTMAHKEVRDILEEQFRANIWGYAAQYVDESVFERDRQPIPETYLEAQLQTALEHTMNNPEFFEALAEEPIYYWEQDCFREFLFDTCTMCTDYPDDEE